MDKPSYLTSTTAIAFLLTIVGYIAFCFVNKNYEGMTKLVEMIVPAYMMTKGMAMGKNGGTNVVAHPVPEVVEAAPASLGH